jgi:protein TonB
MAVRKTENADLRRRYALHVQIGYALALALLVIAFNVPLRPGGDAGTTRTEREIVPLEDAEPLPSFEGLAPPTAPLVEEVPDEAPAEPDDEAPVLPDDQALDLTEAPPPPPSEVPSPSAESEPAPPPEPEVWGVVEQMPALVGGRDGLQRRVAYPDAARAAGIEGSVFVQFVVDAAGAPTGLRVVRGVGGGCDEAALEAVRGARFTPGLQGGRPVPVRMTLEVVFDLPE